MTDDILMTKAESFNISRSLMPTRNDEIKNFMISKDKDEEHYDELYDIISFCRQKIDEVNLTFSDDSITDKRKECAKRCGCFFKTNSITNSKNKVVKETIGYTVSEYNSKSPDEQSLLIPVIPGDLVWCDFAFSEGTYHWGIYMGRKSDNKYGYIIEIDALLKLKGKSKEEARFKIPRIKW